MNKNKQKLYRMWGRVCIVVTRRAMSGDEKKNRGKSWPDKPLNHILLSTTNSIPYSHSLKEIQPTRSMVSETGTPHRYFQLQQALDIVDVANVPAIS